MGQYVTESLRFIVIGAKGVAGFHLVSGKINHFMLVMLHLMRQNLKFAGEWKIARDTMVILQSIFEAFHTGCIMMYGWKSLKSLPQ